ncbi:uncharacterized protein LOC120535121 [Polypterus senegalus]|uniref:uncharacterized protein LOC120535121 n=1 Tax=Polypterus senegalus TaxID=55291 RepID=UPI0019642EC2|nr:uncharacterized protein LOC120535121 [Polypterus senegalus]
MSQIEDAANVIYVPSDRWSRWCCLVTILILSLALLISNGNFKCAECSPKPELHYAKNVAPIQDVFLLNFAKKQYKAYIFVSGVEMENEAVVWRLEESMHQNMSVNKTLLTAEEDGIYLIYFQISFHKPCNCSEISVLLLYNRAEHYSATYKNKCPETVNGTSTDSVSSAVFLQLKKGDNITVQAKPSEKVDMHHNPKHTYLMAFKYCDLIESME